MDSLIQGKGQVIITNNNINNYIISNPKIEVTTNLPHHMSGMAGFSQNGPHISGIHTTIHPSQIQPASNSGKLIFAGQQNGQNMTYGKQKAANLLSDSSHQAFQEQVVVMNRRKNDQEGRGGPIVINSQSHQQLTDSYRQQPKGLSPKV